MCYSFIFATTRKKGTDILWHKPEKKGKYERKVHMNKKVAFIGGDKRMFYCAEALCDYGYECALYGFERISDRSSSTRCGSLRDAVINACAVVLPMPVCRDGIHVNCEGINIKIADVFGAVMPETPIFAGAVSEKLHCMAKDYSRIINDFLDDESLVQKNAYLTAEGAINLAMRSTEKAIVGLNCFVSGYGRIGQYTARILSCLGANVTVIARRELSRSLARLDGHKAVSFDIADKVLSQCDILFNTVPGIVFGERELSSFKGGKLYIELASKPGGIDRQQAERYNIEIEDGSALPTRYCPKTAGKYIADYLKENFERMGII